MEGRLYMWLLCALPGSVTEVCKSHVACSQLIKLSQSSQTAVNGVTSLYSNQRGNMTGCCCWHNVIGGGCKLEDLGVLLDKALDDIHLVNESARSISELCVAGHVGRPELGGREKWFTSECPLVALLPSSLPHENLLLNVRCSITVLLTWAPTRPALNQGMSVCHWFPYVLLLVVFNATWSSWLWKWDRIS